VAQGSRDEIVNQQVYSALTGLPSTAKKEAVYILPGQVIFIMAQLSLFLTILPL